MRISQCHINIIFAIHSTRVEQALQVIGKRQHKPLL